MELKSLAYGMEVCIDLCGVRLACLPKANKSFAFQPSQFELCIVHSLQALKTVLDCKPGEASVSVDLCFYFRSFYVNYCEVSEQGLSENDTGV